MTEIPLTHILFVSTALFFIGMFGLFTRRNLITMLMSILHRATGLGVLFFLVVHVIDTGIIIYRPDWYDHALGLYRHPLFRIGELFIFFGVIYHAANGLRIIVQDFWPYVMERQRQLSLAVAVVALFPEVA